MRDINLVKNNVRKMIEQDAPESDIDEYLGSEGYTPEQLRTVSSNSGFQENIARPALRAAKSVAASAAGLADVANMAFEAPIYAGNRIAGYANKAITGEEPAPYQPVFMKNDVAESTREAFDKYSGGLTANRNNAERLLEVPQEILGGFISPAAAVSGTRQLYSAAKAIPEKLLSINKQTAADFAKSGIKPTLANVSDRRLTNQIQNFLSVTPGAASRIERSLGKQIDDISNKTKEIVGSKGGTIEETGDVISKGAEDYVARTESAMEGLYGNLGQMMGERAPTPLSSTLNYIQGDVGLGDTLSIKKGGTLQNTVETIRNISREEIPNYERIRKLRSKIRREKSTMIGDERVEMEKIYDNLTNDMRESARLNGGEKAVKVFDAANRVYAKQKSFIDETLRPLIEAKTPDKVYDLAIRGVKKGGVNIDKIMGTLDNSQKDFVRGSIVNKMGLASKEQQNAAGDAFSISKFRSDYNSLSKEAKKAIFTPKQRSAYDNLNKVISRIEESSRAAKALPNQYWSWIGLTGAVSSPYLTLPQAAAGVAGARISAQLMTSPKFVNWLAEQSLVKSDKDMAKSIERLGKLAATNSAIREPALDLMNSMLGADDAKAEGPNLSEEEIRQQLLEMNNYNRDKGLPPAYSEEEVKNNPPRIKKRYYRE